MPEERPRSCASANSSPGHSSGWSQCKYSGVTSWLSWADTPLWPRRGSRGVYFSSAGTRSFRDTDNDPFPLLFSFSFPLAGILIYIYKTPSNQVIFLEGYMIQVSLLLYYDSSDSSRLSDSCEAQAEDTQLCPILTQVSLSACAERVECLDILRHNLCDGLVTVKLFLNRHVPVPGQLLLQRYLDDPEACMAETDWFNRAEMLCVASLFKHQAHSLIAFDAFYQHLDLYQVLLAFLICVYYDNALLAQRLFALLREFLFYWKAIQSHYSNPDTDILVKATADLTLELTPQHIRVKQSSRQILLDPVLLRTCFIKDKRAKDALYKVQYRYIQYSITRRKTTDDYEEAEHSYPHRYYIREGEKLICYAFQKSMHSDILLFSKENRAECRHCEDYIGQITRNYWGTRFQLLSHGVSASRLKTLPPNLTQEKSQLMEVIYETNIMGEAPRDFSLQLKGDGKAVTLHSVKPEYNEERDVYQLNFYGRAHRASARNFQIIQREKPDDILLMHCKEAKNTFNLDFRFPFSPLQAVTSALTSISKKFLVS